MTLAIGYQREILSKKRLLSIASNVSDGGGKPLDVDQKESPHMDKGY